ncbi:MAG: HAD family phosphatase [Cyanobacteria bacterium J06648_16]
MLLSRFKAILFDMDGLMLDSETVYHTAWQQAVTELGYTFDSGLYLDLVGRSNAEAERLMLEAFGGDFPVETFRTDWTRHWQRRVQTQGMPTQPGLWELLDFLEAEQMPKAVGTSSNAAEAALSLKSNRLWARFSAIVTVDDVAAGKPAPDIFLLAAQRLGMSPSDCLVLEDSNAGVEAAVTAGCQVIMVPDLQTPTPDSQARALQVCESLHEVLAMLTGPS